MRRPVRSVRSKGIALPVIFGAIALVGLIGAGVAWLASSQDSANQELQRNVRYNTYPNYEYQMDRWGGMRPQRRYFPVRQGTAARPPSPIPIYDFQIDRGTFPNYDWQMDRQGGTPAPTPAPKPAPTPNWHLMEQA